MKVIPRSCLYIVTLTNIHPISVNAQDQRIVDKAIKVTKANCKFGKAKVLEERRKNYYKTFGDEYVNFTPIVAANEIESAEKAILKELDDYRIRGMTGIKNEWLEGIAANKVERIIIDCLDKLKIEYIRIGSVSFI